MFEWGDEPSLETICNNLKKEYEHNIEEEKKIEFYKNLIIEKFISETRHSFSVIFPFDSKFFRSLLNKENDKYKDNYETTLCLLQTHLSDKIKNIEFSSVGYDMYAINAYFTVDDNEYGLTIPVRQNISWSNTVSGNYINWDIGKYRLMIRDGKYSWTSVWCGWELIECDYFKNMG